MIPNLEYYKSIEQDLVNCTRYVEFHPGNFDTYSIEFARIIMASSSEIDTVFKQICRLIDPNSNPETILKYYPIVISRYPKFPTIEMEIPKYNISFKPWDNWSSNSSPTWWQGYNKIKHERNLNFEKANLSNAFNSVGALLSILLYFGIEKCGGYQNFQISAFDAPTLITSKDRDSTQNGGVFVSYTLPDF